MSFINLLKRCVLVAFVVQMLFAGNTGKIAGVVIDAEAKEPLVGANVVVKGTDLGAATDEKGRYYILQVPPGVYTIEINYIGYNKSIIKNVEVRVDLTTRVDAELKRSVMKMEEIVIVAEKPIVQHDVTSTRKSMTRTELEDVPGIENALDIFKLSGGTVLDVKQPVIMVGEGIQLHARDESLKDVHIRGGRGGEVLYIVDGIPVTHPLYGGRSVLDLNVNDVEEIELITGAFNAEYGQAQSGVVNITTRSGKDYYSGSIEYKTDNIIGPSTNTDYVTFSVGGPGLLDKIVLPLLGKDLPGKTNFFISGNANLTNTEYNNHRERGKISLIGVELKEKQDNTGNISIKLDWYSPNSAFHLTGSYHGSWHSWSRFDWLWKNCPDNTVDYYRENHQFSFRFNHTLSKSTFYNINFGYLGIKYRESLKGKTPADFWYFVPDSTCQDTLDYYTWGKEFFGQKPYKVFSIISPPVVDEVTGFYTTDSYESVWRDDNTKTYSVIGSITSQVSHEHKIKSGFEIQFHNLRYIDIQDGGVKLSNYGRWKYGVSGMVDSTARPPGPYPEFGQTRWAFNVNPVVGALYIQDKYEVETLIINAGMRVDWFWLGKAIFKKEYIKQWEDATGFEANWGKYKYSLSPRLGISFPINERTNMFFSYGHFTQLPELQFIYRDPYSGGFTGNPGLDYEKTILYEYGFIYQFLEDWAIDMKVYAKDINNQVGTTRLLAAKGIPVYIYDNKGYGRARGIELRLIKKHRKHVSCNLTYTIQWAKGYSSSAFEDYIRSLNNFPNPIRERRTNWDIRHQLVFQGNISVSKADPIRLFGIELPTDWSITVLSNISSGYPYTPGTTSLLELQVKENSETGPMLINADIKFRKWINVSEEFRINIILDIFNIFDINNVNIGYGFNPWTGLPYRYGDRVNSTKELYSWYKMYNLLDPRQFFYGRNIKLGLKLEW